VLGALLPRGGATLGVAVAMAYGFLRVFEPPGMGAEAVYVLVAAVLVVLVAALLRRDGAGIFAFVHATLLGPVAALVLGCVLDQATAPALGCLRLPIGIAPLPALAVIADWLIGLVIRRRGLRFGLELTAAVIACAILGKPLSTAPLESRVVTAVP